MIVGQRLTQQFQDRISRVDRGGDPTASLSHSRTLEIRSRPSEMHLRTANLTPRQGRLETPTDDPASPALSELSPYLRRAEAPVRGRLGRDKGDAHDDGAFRILPRATLSCFGADRARFENAIISAGILDRIGPDKYLGDARPHPLGCLRFTLILSLLPSNPRRRDARRGQIFCYLCGLHFRQIMGNLTADPRYPPQPQIPGKKEAEGSLISNSRV